MPIALIKATDTCELVNAEDPSVQAPEGAAGWLPVASCAQVGADATRIVVRALNGWEMISARALLEDDADQTPFLRRVLELGLVSIDGSPDKARAFLDAPDAQQLYDVFTAVAEAGAGPFDRGDGSDSIDQEPRNGQTLALAKASSTLLV